MTLFTALVGGVGLFLLGMILLSDGLKAAAGDALRRLLTNLTGGNFKALLSGTAITALVQSSSATTLATIGFVSAGLLTFPQAVGVVFGANLGTTTTGWIVSLIGLKLQMGALALPMIGVGAVMRLLSTGRKASVGLAIAGFGLIFFGIDVLQEGMRDLVTRFDPALLPGDTFGGRMLLVAVGAGMTVVMQSSSAALATTLAALDAGAIDLHRGAALVIGQNLGTTVTAAVAAVGASVPARRTAMAHIGFNLLTGVVALAILPLLLLLLDALRDDYGSATTLAGFHTLFNVLGVVLLFPFIRPFARTITRLVPERSRLVTRHLDSSVAAIPAVAIEAVRRTVIEITGLSAAAALERLGDGPPVRKRTELDGLRDAVHESRQFATTVAPPMDSTEERARHLSLFHAMDHLERLIAACSAAAARDIASRATLEPARHALRSILDETLHWANDPATNPPVAAVREAAGEIADMRRKHRKEVLERTAFQLESTDAGMKELGAMQWIDRVAYHVWRALEHLAGDVQHLPAQH